MKNNGKTKSEVVSADQKITRKQALKKAGLYAATAAGMITLLGAPKKSAAEGSGLPENPTWP
jgi:hypothetical protein